jgi:large conductance mechanosensitive channel
MLKEFKAFIFRGNVIELAVGVIIATAFGAIINSLITDIITPLLLKPALEQAKVTDIAKLEWNGVTYGNFLSATITFIMTAFVLFIVLKGVNKVMKKKEEAPAAPAPTPEDIELLREIRDLLKK